MRPVRPRGLRGAVVFVAVLMVPACGTVTDSSDAITTNTTQATTTTTTPVTTTSAPTTTTTTTTTTDSPPTTLPPAGEYVTASIASAAQACIDRWYVLRLDPVHPTGAVEDLVTTCEAAQAALEPLQAEVGAGPFPVNLLNLTLAAITLEAAEYWVVEIEQARCDVNACRVPDDEFVDFLTLAATPNIPPGFLRDPDVYQPTVEDVTGLVIVSD
ncbi:MAG TPA: hypothetical protein VLB67_13615 [Acidimicrobiia bacterium]|nr:hypothetical protein [Acidimicrobiia bacterium]